MVAHSPYAAVPVLPRGLEEGQVLIGCRRSRCAPSSLRAAVTARPPAERSGELRAAPENSAGTSNGSPGRVREIIPSFHFRPPGRPRKAVPSAAFPASAEALVSLPASEGHRDPPTKSGRGASLAPGQQGVKAGGKRVPSPAEVWGSQRRSGEQRKAEGGGAGAPPGPGLRERSEERAAVPGTRRVRRRERSGCRQPGLLPFLSERSLEVWRTLCFLFK